MDLYRRALSERAAPAAQLEPPAPEVPLSQLMYEDPEKAVLEINRRTYGPLIEQLAANSVEGIYSSLRSTTPEFGEYEPRVRKILTDLRIPPTALNRQYVMMAYYIARGQADEDRSKAARAAQIQNQGQPPTPQPPAPAAPVLSSLEQEIASRTGFVRPDGTVDAESFVKWRDGGPAFSVEVSTEAKRSYGRTPPPQQEK